VTLCLEFIVQANQSILDARFGAEDTIASTRCERRAARAEAHEIVFGKYRPVRREHPFDTATSCPTSPVVRELANLDTRIIQNGYIGVGPRRAALRIEQHVRYDEIAAASCQSIKPMRTAVDSPGERHRRQSRALAQTSPIEHIAKAKHPCARLVIAADLTEQRNRYCLPILILPELYCRTGAVALNLQLSATASNGDLACSGNHCGRVLRPNAVKLALQLQRLRS
jgi:hypothetical protein